MLVIKGMSQERQEQLIRFGQQFGISSMEQFRQVVARGDHKSLDKAEGFVVHISCYTILYPQFADSWWTGQMRECRSLLSEAYARLDRKVIPIHQVEDLQDVPSANYAFA